MTNIDDEFTWGDLGEAWWRENGAACRATDKQILFACARHQGAQQHKAAALAGYSGDGDALRSAGSSAEAGLRCRIFSRWRLLLRAAAMTATPPQRKLTAS